MKRMAAGLLLFLGMLFATAPSTRAQDAAQSALGTGTIDARALGDLIEGGAGDYILVDVRTPAEFANGHIPTAINIPLAEIGKKPPSADKGARIILYCASGARAAMAQKILADMGYSNLLDFGAVSRWKGELQSGE